VIGGLMQHYATCGMLFEGDLDFDIKFANEYISREALRRCIIKESLLLIHICSPSTPVLLSK
jgi:hypothetical protein